MRLIIIITHPVQYFVPLYQYLTRQGMDLEVWYCSELKAAASIDHEFGQAVQWDIPLNEGYRFRTFPNLGSVSKDGTRGFFAYHNPALLLALKAMPPALILVSGWSYSTYAAVLRGARRHGHRLVFRGETHLDMELQRPPWKRWIRKMALRWLLRDVSHFIYIGQQSRRFYKYLGVPDDQLSFGPYAVDNARFQQESAALSKEKARQQLAIREDAFVLLSSGKYIAKKRPADLLHAFAASAMPNAVLVMMGEGPLRPVLERLVIDYGLQDRVILTGFINQSAVCQYYAAADALVMASTWGETWGLAVNEAMNFRLPVMVSDQCGCASDLVVPGVNGFVFPGGDTKALQDCIIQLYQMPLAERQAMGAQSLTLIQNYGFDAIHQALTALLPAG